ncbi:glycosyltransferase family 2 protein [cyanobiont of Ornithocercus magnificus]|nr:glycosyltransferase family 2 protein [cyanobiont of Ornithocercus magnificus]
MHRSGTSLLSGVLQQLGAAFPGEMIASDTYNPEGYFEWRQVVDIQERLLVDLNRWWPSPEGALALPKGWLQHPATQAASRQLHELLAAVASLQSSPWVIKDPRCSRLLPLWSQLTTELDLPLRLLLAVRNPAEVVHSLLRRDGPLTGLDTNQGQQIWWRHNLEVIHATRLSSSPLAVFDFECWFNNPEAQIQDLLKACPEIKPRADQCQAALEMIHPEYCHSLKVAALPLLPPVRRLYRLLKQRPLPQRWPTAEPPATLRLNLQAKSAAIQASATDPTAWPDLLIQWRNYPAPRFAKHVQLAPEFLISSCGLSWCELWPHLLLQHLPLPELKYIYLDSNCSNHHQLCLRSIDRAASINPTKDELVKFITLNLELPPPERAAHWLAHMHAQQLIWDPDPARVRLLRTLGLPAWWLDPSAPNNGWMQQSLATDPNRWASELGLPPPIASALVVLGPGGADWEKGLAAETALGKQIKPTIAYLPGWPDLIVATPTAGLIRAGWLAAAAHTAARLIEASTTKASVDWTLLDGLQAPPLVLGQPFTPLELRALHAGKRLMAAARDVPSPPTEELFHWKSSELPRAAVLVSSYNYADRIGKALDSVLAQQQSELELIVVDDASADGGASVIQNWMQEHIGHRHPFQRMLLLRHQHNAGLAATRNTAFTAAHSSWCFVLDADNALYPGAVSVCLSLAEAGGNSLAVVHPLIAIKSEPGQLEKQHVLIGCQSWQRDRFLSGNYIDAMALVRRSAWQAVDGYSDIADGWEDYDFWCKLVAAGWNGIQCPQVLAIYHSHIDSMSQTVTRRSWRPLSRTLQVRHPWLKLPLAQP